MGRISSLKSPKFKIVHRTRQGQQRLCSRIQHEVVIDRILGELSAILPCAVSSPARFGSRGDPLAGYGSIGGQPPRTRSCDHYEWRILSHFENGTRKAQTGSRKACFIEFYW